MFQLISSEDLHYNEKYKIIGIDTYSGIYKGKVWSDQLYLEFESVKNLNCTWYEPRYFLPTRLFYKFIPQKQRIQTDMERRALNKIIRRVLGDDYFNW